MPALKKLFLPLPMRLLFFLIAIVRFASAHAQTSGELNVVNWNLEWFGDNPSTNSAELLKTKLIMDQIDADVYALVEIVDVNMLAVLVQSLNGNYDFVVSEFGSFASSASDPDYASAQKLAFVYKTDKVRNVTGRALLKGSSFAYGNWASGRFPFLVNAEVKATNNTWIPFLFVVIHAKANADGGSCDRRYYGCNEMKDTLDHFFPNDRIILLGDFNDDLDNSICSNYPYSNYINLVSDSLDAISYKSVTLPLSKTGVSSIDGFSNMIDHVVVSNEVYPMYVQGSAKVLKDEVESWVSNYTHDVSDHYPVKTQFIIDPTTGIHENQKTEISLCPNPAQEYLIVKGVKPAVHYAVFSLAGKLVCDGHLPNDDKIMLNTVPSGVYLLRLRDGEKEMRSIFIKQ